MEKVLKLSADHIMLKQVTVEQLYEKNDCELTFIVAKISIAICNIISNAIDAMAYNKGDLIISTKLCCGKCIVKIIDNGCGISKENIDHIFTPYYTNKSGNLGLGLTAAQYILNDNNASLYVKSTEGEGTVFTIMFDDKLMQNT